MKPPIIVIGDGGPFIFESVGAAEGYVEPVDVLNNEYPAAYDSEGRLLRLTVREGWNPRVEIVPVETEPHHAAELRQFIADYLATHHVAPPEQLSQATLDQLVAMFLKFHQERPGCFALLFGRGQSERQ